MHLIPKATHDTDFSRIKNWYLDSKCVDFLIYIFIYDYYYYYRFIDVNTIILIILIIYIQI